MARRGAPDGDFVQAAWLGAAMGVSAVLVFAFNAALGRLLGPADFATFGALLSVLLTLSGAVAALLGGGAMAAARTGSPPRPTWRRPVLAASGLFALAAWLPLGPTLRAASCFGMAAGISLLSGWNRGVLIGLGRSGAAGTSLVVEGLARLGFMLALVAGGGGLMGAAWGLGLGVAAGAVSTEAMLSPRASRPRSSPVAAEVWLATGGLVLVSTVQFLDVAAVRLLSPGRAASYAAAAALARVVLFSQAPAAAYAIRRAATTGVGPALRRALPFALLPAGVAALILCSMPRLFLSISYGDRYLEAVGTLRVLAVAMIPAGLTVVLLESMMGAGRVAWAWTCGAVAVAGMVAIVQTAARPNVVPSVMVAVHASLLGVAAAHVRRVLAAGRPARGAVLILNWRDRAHPQGGGSEVYVEEMARRLVAGGRPVGVFCAAHHGAPREEVRHGVRFVRRGGRWTVYGWAALYHVLGRFGPHDVVIDVHNGVPFFSPLYCGRPVVVLVHHVHQEQWAMWFGPRVARLGWWIESWLSPRVYRKSDYVAVSSATGRDLERLGVDPERITVIHNGAPEGVDIARAARASHPTICYVGRLVPHKRVDLLIRSAADLTKEVPELRVRVIGRGPSLDSLRVLSDRLGIGDVVRFDGFVGETAKTRALAEAWVLALPSVKEGWGLVVSEAAAVATPAVAFRLGGLVESVRDGETGILVDSFEGFVEALRSILVDEDLRDRMGCAARAYGAGFRWEESAARLDALLADLERELVEEQIRAGEPVLATPASGG